MNRTISLYDQAAARVNDDPDLAPIADFILADWPEGDEHWQWVITADRSEILDWAAAAHAEREAFAAGAAADAAEWEGEDRGEDWHDRRARLEAYNSEPISDDVPF